MKQFVIRFGYRHLYFGAEQTGSAKYARSTFQKQEETWGMNLAWTYAVVFWKRTNGIEIMVTVDGFDAAETRDAIRKVMSATSASTKFTQPDL